MSRTVGTEKRFMMRSIYACWETALFLIFYYFLYYSPLSGSNDIVKESIIQHARFDALVVTELTCSEQREKQCGKR